MTRRIVAAVLAAAVAATTLTGCRAEPSSSGAQGVVVNREKKRNYGKSWRKYHYTVTVQEDGGRKDTGRVSRAVFDSCEVGARWPDCKP
ncbi:hypothetical protein [Micromonospora tulbaghiae]|uniref:hypothetical protein n=1 Tax=Micromonospora tulbaghiae TaxID=479978 RepID=UPI0033C05E31